MGKREPHTSQLGQSSNFTFQYRSPSCNHQQTFVSYYNNLKCLLGVTLCSISLCGVCLLCISNMLYGKLYLIKLTQPFSLCCLVYIISLEVQALPVRFLLSFFFFPLFPFFIHFGSIIRIKHYIYLALRCLQHHAMMHLGTRLMGIFQ